MTYLLADTSVWGRHRHPTVADRWDAETLDDTIATTPMVRLEVLFSARSARDYAAIETELDALHQVPAGEAVFARALNVQRALAHKGGLHHRSVGISDLLIAAAAELGGATVWHYDEDFDRIAEVTGQPTEWIVPRGSV
jgi:predicted nucleic acid-binding protein